MRDDICTIPVSEVFEVKDGCPLCRMHKTVEDRIIGYIMGDAMMEPDVRIMTNKTGFCREHYRKMTEREGRLQLALMLESHINHIRDTALSGENSLKSNADTAAKVDSSCFICDKIKWGEDRMIATVYRLYENEPEFRELFNSQPQFCFTHYTRLISGITKKNCKKHGKELAENLSRITAGYAEGVSKKITGYCSFYDYRHAGKNDFGDSRFAVEEALEFLTGDKFK